MSLWLPCKFTKRGRCKFTEWECPHHNEDGKPKPRKKKKRKEKKKPEAQAGAEAGSGSAKVAAAATAALAAPAPPAVNCVCKHAKHNWQRTLLGIVLDWDDNMEEADYDEAIAKGEEAAAFLEEVVSKCSVTLGRVAAPPTDAELRKQVEDIKKQQATEEWAKKKLEQGQTDPQLIRASYEILAGYRGVPTGDEILPHEKFCKHGE